MKKFSKRLICLAMLWILCFSVSVPAIQTTAAAKTGWFNKTYYYKNGKKVKSKLLKIKNQYYYFNKKGKVVKNKLMTIEGAVYYFDKNGKALKKKWKTVGKYRYYFAANGKAKKGIVTIAKNYNYQLYSFDAKGRLNAAKTKQLQAACKYLGDFAPLKKLLGNPKSSSYADSCLGLQYKKDGILKYNGFTIFTTLRTDGKELFMGVE